MNQNWTQFLLSQHAVFESEDRIVFAADSTAIDKAIYPIPHLSVLKVTGKDSAKLLQGQMTCNVNDVTESQSTLGAFCNPKGRAIATFLLIKTHDAFLLVLPADLLQTVKARLQKYVLRSDVVFTDCSDELCLLGISHADEHGETLFATHHQEIISVGLSLTQTRCLLIADSGQAIKFWSRQVSQFGFKPGSSNLWRCLDLLSGLPWLSAATSEEFIPQMLNLDKMGGISFNKGCYTGQEIVARTHYLGKTKREMFLAEADAPAVPEPNSAIIDKAIGPETIAGRVLSACRHNQICKMLIILPIPDSGHHDFRLLTPNQEKLTILRL